jgi:hypothetical protein
MSQFLIYLSNFIYLIIANQYYIHNMTTSCLIYIFTFIFSTIYHYKNTKLTLILDYLFATSAIFNNFFITYLKIIHTYEPDNFSTTLSNINYLNLIGSVMCFSSLYIKKIQHKNYHIYHSLYHLISGLGALLLII